MKKILNFILVTAILGTFLPYSALAETTNVGVNITGSVSIDVVTTISANITLDLTTGETTPTYMEIKNNSLVPVNVSITDISASQGAPNKFVKQTDKNWDNLNRDDTEYYVNFNILGEGQNVSPKDILADTYLHLGTLDSKSLAGKDCSLATEFCYDSIESDTKIFEINANFGKNWSSGDKNFTYQITTVYAQSKDYAEPVYTLPDTFERAQQLSLYAVDNELPLGNDSSKMYIGLNFSSNNFSEGVLNQDLNKVTLIVNGQNATSLGVVGGGADGFGLFESLVSYSIPALEGSSSGTTHYLNIKVMIDNETYSFIEKVIVYSE